MAGLRLRLVTPRGEIVGQEVESVVVPSTSGELEILPGHRDFATVVAPGLLRFRAVGDQSEVLGFVAEGSCEVSLADGLCTVLVEDYEPVALTEEAVQVGALTVPAIVDRYRRTQELLADENLSGSRREDLQRRILAFERFAQVSGTSLHLH